MEKIDGYLAELAQRLKAPKPQQYLQSMGNLSEHFKTTLKDVPARVKQRETAREQLKQSSVRTSDVLAQLASDLPDQEDEKALDAVESLRLAIEQAEDRATSPAWAANSLDAYAQAVSDAQSSLELAQAAVEKLAVDSGALKNVVLSIRTHLTRLRDSQLNTEKAQDLLSALQDAGEPAAIIGQIAAGPVQLRVQA